MQFASSRTRGLVTRGQPNVESAKQEDKGMRRAILIATTALVALMFALTLGVSAQQPDTHDRTIMTFSAPVELPGMRLDTGTYVWKLADTPNRNVIQVFDKDEKMILG